MDRKALPLLLLVALILAVVRIPEARAQPPPEYYRGPDYQEYVYSNGTVKWSSAPRYVHNGSHWVPYIYQNKSQYGYLQIQSGLVACRIYSYYTVILDPDVTEIRVYDERWEVQRWKKTGPGGWDDIGAQSGTPVYDVSQRAEQINITKSFHSWA